MPRFLAGTALTAALLITTVGAVAEPTAQAQLACEAPTGASGCWVLHLDEPFSGTELNTDIWEPGWFVDQGYSKSVAKGENACYNSDQVRLAGGLLTLHLDATTSSLCLDKQGDVAPYVGGLISSRDAINDASHAGRLDGSFYLEARVRAPSIDGQVRNWPLFWSTGFGPWPRTGEFDVLEGLRGKLKYNYHFECPVGGGNCNAGATPLPAASSDGGWHTYAVERRLGTNGEPTTATYFFDGEPVATIADNVVDSPHYIIFSYSSHRTHDVTTTGLAMDVDWVRVYHPAGDLTCDSTIDRDDVVAILEFLTGARSASSACPLGQPATQLNASAGDVDGDGQLTVADALLLAAAG